MTEPTDINTAPLTHIVYSFADVQSDGTIVLTDSYADEQVRLSSIHAWPLDSRESETLPW